MVDKVVSKQELIDAQKDAKTLEDIVNGEPNLVINSRLGRLLVSLATIGAKTFNTDVILDSISGKTQKQINDDLNNGVVAASGGKYSFTTYAKFDTAKATIPANSMVNIDEAPTGTTTWGQGLNTWDGTTLSKSVNDPLAQATTKIKESEESTRAVDKKRVEIVFNRTANKFNLATMLDGYNINSVGAIVTTANRSVSDFIPVEAGKRYKRVGGPVPNNDRVNAYDINKQPIVVSGSDVFWQTGFESATIPANVAYVRASLDTSRVASFMIVENTVNTSFYIPYYTLNMESDYAKKAILFNRTANLFNKDTVLAGYFGVDGVTYQTNATYHCSDFIAVEEGKRYKRVNCDTNRIVYAYDANKQPVAVNGSIVYWQSAFESTDIPVGVAYIRVAYPSSQLNVLMLVESTYVVNDYVPYYQIRPELLKSIDNIHPNSYTISGLGSLDYHDWDRDYSHLIFYGQSLSMGYESPEVLTTNIVPKTFMLGSRVWMNQGNVTVSTLNPLQQTLGPQCGETPIISAAHAMRMFLNRNKNNTDLVATSCGEAGKTIEQLSKECTNGTNYFTAYFQNALNRLKTIATNASKTVGCPAIVFMQGEFNYTGTTGAGLTPGTNATSDKDTYKALLLQLKNDMQAAIMTTYEQTRKPLFFIYQVGGQYINNDEMTINMAQLEFADENDDVVLLNPTYGVPDYNGGHLSSNGYRWYAELIAKQLYYTYYDNKRGHVARAKEFEVNSAKDKIYIHCQVPNPPLVIDTYTTAAVTGNGFKVWDDSGALTVINTKIVSGTMIEITLNRPLTTNAKITYAGKDRTGSGNIRDSDRWSSMYNYTDETSYAKKPTYTPKRSDGVTPIYGDKYPLYNWLIAFYKKLT